jgi:hypothetical protein
MNFVKVFNESGGVVVNGVSPPPSGILTRESILFIIVVEAF